MRSLLLLSLLTTLLAACASGDGGTSLPDTATATDSVTDSVTAPETLAPGRRVVLDDGQGRSLVLEWDERGEASLSLRRMELALARSQGPLFEVGTVGAYDEAKLYDPHPHPQGMYWVPHDLAWAPLRVADAVAPTPAEDGSVTLRLAGEGITGTLLLAHAGDGSFRADWRAEAEGRDIVFFRVNLHAPEGEQYYGLGEYMDQVPHRGRHRAMHMVIDPTQESGYNEAHVPIPFFTGTRGWGLFIEDRHPGNFDMAADDPARVAATFFQREGLRMYFFAAREHPLEVPGLYTRVTGAPALPPLWSFAPIQWRDEIPGQAEVIEDAETMRALDFPAGAIWVDRPWQVAYGSHTFRPDWYPDAAGMVERLHALGYRFAVWTVPYIAESYEPHYSQALENDYFIPFPEGWPLGLDGARQLDLSSAAARDFYAPLIAEGTAIGVEGYKLDYAETVQVGIMGTRLSPMTFANGESELTMHRSVAYYYHLPYAESVDDAFLLSRAGTYGDQTLTTTIWPGDLCANFAFHGEDLDDGEKPHVGGLPAAITAGLSLSVSGYPWYASDTGGYRHDRPTKEVLVRWHEYSALHPIMQIGGGNNHRPWDFEMGRDGIQYDEETLDLCRLYARLHLRLFPYYYALSQQAHQHGYPVVRPFGMAYPADGRHPSWDFLVGADLLVSPVYRGGQTSREVPFPEGRWVDWWDGTVYEGPADIEVAAPLGRLPLFLRAGAIVPLLRPTIDTLASVTEEGIESFTNEAGALYLRVVPEGRGRFVAHDGTDIELVEDGGVTVTVAPGDLFADFVLELEWAARGAGGAAAPASVTLDGEALSQAAEVTPGCRCWRFDAARGLLHAAFPGGVLQAD